MAGLLVSASLLSFWLVLNYVLADSQPVAASPTEETERRQTGPVGVAACDDFLFKFDACIESKLPVSQRDPFKKQISDLTKSWSAAALGPRASFQAIEQSCVAYADKVRAVFQPFGCKF